MKAATPNGLRYAVLLTISIHAAREGGDYLHDVESANYDISIHAAREGGDITFPADGGKNEISIHAAREGGDSCAFVFAIRSLGFQSTPPVKAATIKVKFAEIDRKFQSTPPVKAATIKSQAIIFYQIEFQSTPPVKAATGIHIRPKSSTLHFNPRRP